MTEHKSFDAYVEPLLVSREPRLRACLHKLTEFRQWKISYAAQVTRRWLLMPVLQAYQDLGANPNRGNGYTMSFRSVIHF